MRKNEDIDKKRMIKVLDDHLSLSHIFGMLSRVFFSQKSRRKENLIRGSVLRFEKFSFPIILLCAICYNCFRFSHAQ